MDYCNEDFEENNPPDITIPEFLPLILQHWFDLQPDEIEFHYHGTYNVFIIRGEYILRIPDRDLRNSQGLKLLAEEEQKLTFFHRSGLSTPTLQLPKPIYVHQDDQIPYMYYRLIPGQSLSRNFDALSPTTKTHIANQIAQFLDQFHSSALAQDFAKEFPQHPSRFSSHAYYDGWKVLYEKSQHLLYPLLPIEGQNWLSDVFESFLDHPELLNFQPTVVHGDFDTSNILIDESLNSNSVVGVIDFEGTHIGDPAADLLFFREGPSFLKQILDHRHRTVIYDEYIRNRMKFLYCRTCIPYLEWGMEHDRPSMVEYGIQRLRRLMKKFPDPDVMNTHFF